MHVLKKNAGNQHSIYLSEAAIRTANSIQRK